MITLVLSSELSSFQNPNLWHMECRLRQANLSKIHYLKIFFATKPQLPSRLIAIHARFFPSLPSTLALFLSSRCPSLLLPNISLFSH